MDARAVKNFITSWSRDSLHTVVKEPPVKGGVCFILHSRDGGKGNLGGLASSYDAREGKLRGVG